MKKLLFFIFLTSCTSSSSTFKDNSHDFDFNKVLNFDEFTQLLIKYAKETPYPNIDK
jgi:hypothetical protein